ncbi:VOC family protein [Dictyobacter kobayashii]|uniref:Glyoxalase n=1 Tax=Dictyobacter kobayashii TaxID=2014872 RepID=A0A402ABS3_9CHLR|nr:VOC family protein [Dictyobacter kobayashii]GCE16554.1 glyoxalase [Dictyobacter kobayashii]
MKLICVRLLISDFAVSLNFWHDIVGLSLKYSDETMGYAYFELDGTGLELFKRDEFVTSIGEVPASHTAQEWQTVLNFQVEDVDATYAELVKRGAHSIARPQDRPAWQARTAHFSDPDGHILEIYSPLGENELPTA